MHDLFSIFVDALADRINGSHQGKRQGAFLFASESHHGVLSDWGAGKEGGVNTPDDSTPETERSSYRKERSKALWTQSGCRYFNDVDSGWKQINRIRLSVGFKAWHSFQSCTCTWASRVHPHSCSFSVSSHAPASFSTFQLLPALWY